MKIHPNKDFVAEAIADYEAMTAEEQGKILVSILEDQPILMGFVTNLADDFTDSTHEVLVDSVVILINAFVAAGIPVGMIPQAIIEDVIKEKIEMYEKLAEKEGEPAQAESRTDSPIVFEDLRNRALFKSDLKKDDAAGKQNFNLALDTVISIIERSAAAEIEEKEDKG